MEPTAEQEEVRRDQGADLLEVKHRVARLEAGVRLVAQTLRGVHSDLSAALSDLREEVVMTATAVDVRRIVTEVVQPLTHALEEFLGVASSDLQGESPGPSAAAAADTVPASDPPVEEEPDPPPPLQGDEPTGGQPVPEWAPLPPDEASSVTSQPSP